MPAVTVTKQIHFSMRNRGRREIVEGPLPVPEVIDEGRVPRIARLMALAIRIEGLITSGAIADQAEAARLGHITRARMTQIINLLLLAPDIQEAILNLPRVTRGRDPIVETHLRRLVQERSWTRQREAWVRLVEVRAGARTPTGGEPSREGAADPARQGTHRPTSEDSGGPRAVASRRCRRRRATDRAGA